MNLLEGSAFPAFIIHTRMYYMYFFFSLLSLFAFCPSNQIPTPGLDRLHAILLHSYLDRPQGLTNESSVDERVEGEKGMTATMRRDDAAATCARARALVRSSTDCGIRGARRRDATDTVR